VYKTSLRRMIGPLAARFLPQSLLYASSVGNWREFRIKADKEAVLVIHERSKRLISLSRATAIYIVDFVECFDYYFNSVSSATMQIGGSRYRVVDFSRPAYHDVSVFDDFPIFCPSFMEPFVTARQYLDFARLLPGDVVLDLGAYVGLTAIAFSKAVGKCGLVIGIEPDPANFAAAEQNISRHADVHGLDNIRLFHAAVSGSNDALSFSAEGALGSAAQSIIGRGRGKSLAVNSYTLDRLADVMELSRVDFVKMDIEGSEEDLLRNSERFFRRYRPKIVIEPHIVNGERSDEALRSVLSTYHYVSDTITQSGVSALPLITGIPNAA
jgi:FkbM family methyltransferase